jgi:hypothetical protein
MADTLLHGLIYSEWEETKFAKATTATDDDDEDEMDGIESDYDVDEIDVRNHSNPSSGSGSGSGRYKELAREKREVRKVKKRGVDIGSVEIRRKYDLGSIAKNGGGGKVMYMFEKVSKSKMLAKTEV